jgi:hypothetical protein
MVDARRLPIAEYHLKSSPERVLSMSGSAKGLGMLNKHFGKWDAFAPRDAFALA